MPVPPAAILTDIEGTTTPIAFVHDVLFPYARTHLRAYLDAAWAANSTRDAIDKLTAEHAADVAAATMRGGRCGNVTVAVVVAMPRHQFTRRANRERRRISGLRARHRPPCETPENTKAPPRCQGGATTNPSLQLPVSG